MARALASAATVAFAARALATWLMLLLLLLLLLLLTSVASAATVAFAATATGNETVLSPGRAQRALQRARSPLRDSGRPLSDTLCQAVLQSAPQVAPKAWLPTSFR